MTHIIKRRTGNKNYFTLRLGKDLWNELNNYFKTRNDYGCCCKVDILIEAINYHLPQWIGDRRSRKVPGFKPINIEHTKYEVEHKIQKEHYSMAVELDEEYLKQLKIVAIERDQSWRSMFVEALKNYLQLVANGND